MSGLVPATATFYRPAEVARMPRCSEWCVKEQARQRRIPYSWIGGSYLFTEQHIAEIVRRFEVRPTDTTTASVVPARRARRASEPVDATAPVRLTARIPRRARTHPT